MFSFVQLTLFLVFICFKGINFCGIIFCGFKFCGWAYLQKLNISREFNFAGKIQFSIFQ